MKHITKALEGRGTVCLTSFEIARRKAKGLPYWVCPGGVIYNMPEKKSKKRKGKKPKKRLPTPPNIHATSYKVYLRSPYWLARRLVKLKNTNGLCERCDRKASQVHHKHYKSLGRESDKDLESLCGACHYSQHKGAIEANKHLRSI